MPRLHLVITDIIHILTVLLDFTPITAVPPVVHVLLQITPSGKTYTAP
jgi:hypothetical protein